MLMELLKAGGSLCGSALSTARQGSQRGLWVPRRGMAPIRCCPNCWNRVCREGRGRTTKSKKDVPNEADSLQKTLMLGKIVGRRKKGHRG